MNDTNDKKTEYKLQLNELEKNLESKILTLIGKEQFASNGIYIRTHTNFQIIKVLNYLIYEFSGWMQESIENYKEKKSEKKIKNSNSINKEFKQTIPYKGPKLIYLAGKINTEEEGNGVFDFDESCSSWRSSFIGNTIKMAEGENCEVSSCFERIKIIGAFRIDHNCLQPYSCIPTRCFSLIKKADIFFAWIDKQLTFGTYIEIGYAKALNKPILIGTNLSKKDREKLYFIFGCADEISIKKTPIEACKECLKKKGYI